MLRENVTGRGRRRKLPEVTKAIAATNGSATNAAARCCAACDRSGGIHQ